MIVKHLSKRETNFHLGAFESVGIAPWTFLTLSFVSTLSYGQELRLRPKFREQFSHSSLFVEKTEILAYSNICIFVENIF